MECYRLARLRAHLGHLYRDRADAGLHIPFRVVAVADNGSMAIGCLSVLETCHEFFKLGLHCRLQKFARTFAQQVRQRVRDRISTGKFNNVTLVHGGASSLVGGLCRNDSPTRCTASFQITQTPDSVIAPACWCPRGRRMRSAPRPASSGAGNAAAPSSAI